MNQRPGKWKPAALNDNTKINLRDLISFVKQAQTALEERGEEDAALRFEIFKEYLQEDVANGKPFRFSSTALGL